MQSSNTFTPKTQDQKIDTFIQERGRVFLEIIQLHSIFARDPANGSSELLFFLQDVRQDLFRFSALVKIIRAAYKSTLSADEQRGWQECWHRKVRLIRYQMDEAIGFLGESQRRRGGEVDSHKCVAAYVLMLAVSIGRLHYEKVDPALDALAFERYVCERAEDIEREVEHNEGLKDIWVNMTENILCPCEYCILT